MSGNPTPFEYGSNYANLDRDHELLIQILNELKTTPDAPVNVLNELRLRLLAYLDAHFEHEEDLMDAFHYSEADTHKACHREILERARSAPALDASSVSTYVSAIEQGIEEHMCGVDRKLANFLSQQNQPAHAGLDTGAFE